MVLVSRLKISASLNDFRRELGRLRYLERHSQKRLSVSNRRPRAGTISKKQLHLIAEGLFFSAFRAYENVTEEIFLLYCMGKSSPGGIAAKPYINPSSFKHAHEMIQSTQPFLDWASPDNVLKRSELYLQNGFPVKDVLTANMVGLRALKHIRNHIAHNSSESLAQYKKVLRNALGTLPTKIPGPGEFVLMNDPNNVGNCFLHTYMDTLEQVVGDIAP